MAIELIKSILALAIIPASSGPAVAPTKISADHSHQRSSSGIEWHIPKVRSYYVNPQIFERDDWTAESVQLWRVRLRVIERYERLLQESKLMRQRIRAMQAPWKRTCAEQGKLGATNVRVICASQSRFLRDYSVGI